MLIYTIIGILSYAEFFYIFHSSSIIIAQAKILGALELSLAQANKF